MGKRSSPCADLARRGNPPESERPSAIPQSLPFLKASHFSHSPEEMKRYYFDVLSTGESLGVAMPRLSSLREQIECYPTIYSTKIAGAVRRS